MAPWKGTEPTLQQGAATLWQSLRGEEGWRPPPAPWQPPQGTQARWAREGAGLWPAGGSAPGSSGVGGILRGSAWGCVGSQWHGAVQLLPEHPSSANTASHPSRHAQAPAEPLAPSPLPTAAPENLTPKPQDLSRQLQGARLRPHPVQRQNGVSHGCPPSRWPRTETRGWWGFPAQSHLHPPGLYPGTLWPPLPPPWPAGHRWGRTGGPHKAMAGKAYAAEPARPDSALDAGHSFGMKGAIMGSPVLPPAPSAPLRGAPWAAARPPEHDDEDGGTTRAGG